MAVHTLFLLHSHLLAVSNAVFPLQTPASVMELVGVPDAKEGTSSEVRVGGVMKLVDLPDSKSGSARSVGSSPTAPTTTHNS